MDKELLAEFLLESNENMSTIEQQLMDLESNASDASLLDAIFRTIHTVKGSCGFIGLKRLEKVAHAGENVLGRMRSHGNAVTPEIISLLLDCADAVQEILDGLQENGLEPEVDHSTLIEKLHAAEALIGKDQGDVGAGDPAADSSMWLDDFPGVAEQLGRSNMKTPEQVLQAGFNELKKIDGITPPLALKILGAAKKEAANDTKRVEEKELRTEECVTEKKGRTEKKGDKSRMPTLKVAQGKNVEVSTQKKKTASAPQVAESIRVNVSVLDSLMNQVGELVLTRNRLLNLTSSLGSRALLEESGLNQGSLDALKSLLPLSRDLNQITEGLQNQLLKTRMQPVSTIWGSVPRIVRDIGKQLHKKIQVVMEGQDTELDRTILAALKDPLTHIIRNSCDHGIELPAERLKSGKPETGTLTLKASQEAGSILISISDDGGGIDADRVKQKAVNMSVLDENAASTISDNAALQLIFHPGLSTASKVSNFSGRGVGMDVVKNAIEKVGGSVEIQSETGVGTTLSIRIPLTMAIISGMLVKCASQLYALPQISVQELLAANAGSPHWCMVADKPFFRLRGQLLPVVRLGDVLEIPDTDMQGGSIVVVNAGNRRIGLLVDEIIGAEELVVKPLGMHFSEAEVFGGCSILGDGGVIPILECNGLIHNLDIPVEVENSGVISETQHVAEADKQYTLTFAAAGKRYAIPMLLIERLEMVATEDIEQAGDREVLQFRGQVIPVLRWNRLVDAEDIDAEESCCLIIADNDKRMCLQVDKVEDILETELHISMKSSSHMFLGTSVIQGKATELVDVFELLKVANSDWFSGRGDNVVCQKVLFAEDAPFFRTMLTPVLESMNFEVWHARDGQEARLILEQKTPDIVLTDIEMPNMNGYELAHWIREHQRFEHIPIAAITSSPPSEDDERSQLFNVVIGKTDRDALIEYLTDLSSSCSESVSPETASEVVYHGPVLVGGVPRGEQ